MRVLVTGATGYIGGRLVPALLERGHEVRCLARDPAKLARHPWRDRVDVVRGDVLDPGTLSPALQSCTAAYYLVHSMGGDGDFEERDRRAASNFRDAATAAGVSRIVYLGGMGRGDDLSAHLASRHEVGAVLAAGPVPVTELRAAVIIGSGSVSFEMLRYLTEVLPVMTTPRWVRTRCQPIAVGNVLEILVNVLDEDHHEDRVYEIGGPDVLTYEDMMRVYAREAGLPRRLIIPVPLLSPGLSSLWVGLVTPLPTGVARPLVGSLRNEVTVADLSHSQRLSGRLVPYREAVRLALEQSRSAHVDTRWSDAWDRPSAALPTDPAWSGGTIFTDVRRVHAAATPRAVFRAFARVGGEVGYYGFDGLWRLRGLIDAIIGGVGLRRGRRHPDEVRPGDAVDFWRVTDVDPGRSLLLYAEMKLPGEALLHWEAIATDGGTDLTQTATFAPRGLLGRLYWLVLLPFHGPIFRTMARRIASYAETLETESAPDDG